MELPLSIIGIVITFVSFAWAIISELKYGKLINYNREMAWEIYRQISASLQFYQEIQPKLKDIKSNEIQILELVTRGEHNDQELLLSAIKMIKRVEKKFDESSITKWSEGKIIPNESHLLAFKKYLLK
ncbi:MAG: hypothetical protein JXA91_07700 [Candidatus Thermoplasmatota archaeon]|nr:hypothetical protein [Candidatus Thermoplasmatota archaeon]